MDETIMYRIYRYEDNQINASIQELYRASFQVDIRDEFQWKFLQNPKGQAIAVIAMLDDKLIGHSAVMPCEVNVKGNSVDAIISMGTMIHSSYIGQKIGSSMMRYLLQYLSESKYAFIIGFPNENSFSMFTTKLGLTHLRDYHFISFNNNYIESRNHYELADLDSVCLNLEPVGNSICLNRDNQYLKWRYGNKKYKFFKSSDEKFFVITEFQNKFDIVYWSPKVSKQDIRDFADFIYCMFPVKEVSTWDTFDLGDVVDTIGERKYHFCIKKLKSDLTEDVYNEKEWIWLMGDSELF